MADNQHGFREDPKQKRQKVTQDEAIVSPSKESKSITNIHYDCLERIYDLLDVENLLMVAQTCKRLQIAAAAYFGDRYSKMHIHFSMNKYENSDISIKDDVDTIYINGLKLCLSFLRCFGAKLSRISVVNDDNESNNKHMYEYINQYCADTLDGIDLNDWVYLSKAFRKPLKNVEEVQFKFSQLVGNELSKIADWFPNLQHLKFHCCNVDDTALANVSFPHLKHMEFAFSDDNIDWDNCHSLNIADAANILQANLQVQILYVNFNKVLTLGSILDAIKGNSNITTLMTGPDRHTIAVNMYELSRFIIEHPLMVELFLYGYRLLTEDAINFSRQMGSLKRFMFQVHGRVNRKRLLRQLENGWQFEVMTSNAKTYIRFER